MSHSIAAAIQLASAFAMGAAFALAIATYRENGIKPPAWVAVCYALWLASTAVYIYHA